MSRVDKATDLSPARIVAAVERIDPVFLNTPQLVSDDLSAALGHEVIVKDETVTPIGSFKGRGTWLLAERLDPTKVWVCSTAGNFGQGVAYAGRARGASVEVFVSDEVAATKLDGLRSLGAHVHVTDDPSRTARDHVAASEERLLVVDGLEPEIAEGAGTIALELERSGPIDVAVVQIGDGALITGIACWLKHARPQTRIVGVCASGAPAIARSVAAGKVVTTPGTDTIATALAISEPIPESLARITALVDEIVLVEDDDLRSAQGLIARTIGTAVEPAGAAGVAALARYRDRLPPGRTAAVLTGAGTPGPIRQPTLHIERLSLVPLADEHLPFEIELDSDPEVMRYLTGRALAADEVAQAHRRRVAAAGEVPGLGLWAGFADHDFVGWWCLRPPHGPDQPRVAGEAELGFRLLRRHWRNGYASEGARELIRYGFEDVGLDRIFAQTMAVNAASRATMAAIGLTFARRFVSGEAYDEAVSGADQGDVEYEITRTTWQLRLTGAGTAAPKE